MAILHTETAAEESARVTAYFSASPDEQAQMRQLGRINDAYDAVVAAREASDSTRHAESLSAMLAVSQEYPEAHAEWIRLRMQAE